MRRRSFSLTSPANGCELRSRCPSSNSSRRISRIWLQGRFSSSFHSSLHGGKPPPRTRLHRCRFSCPIRKKTGVRVDLLDDQPCHLEASAVDMRMPFSDDGVSQRVPPLAARAVGPLPVVLDSGRFMRFVGDIDHGPVLDGPSFSASIRGFALTIPHSIPRPVSEASPVRIAALRSRNGVPARAAIVISPAPRSSS